MPSETLRGLVDFFRSARHLWGRCPRCGDLFRLSDAAISFGSEPPRDWLRRLQGEQESLRTRTGELENWQAEVDGREAEVAGREREVAARERNIVRQAQNLAKQMLKDDRQVKRLLTEARRDAVVRSRATLLGKLFERLAPSLQRFNHDPRDVRALMDPIDYIVFDGLTVNKRVDRIRFVEVKSGTSVTSSVQRSIFEAVREGRVGTEVWQFGKRGVPLEQQLLGGTGSLRALPPGNE